MPGAKLSLGRGLTDCLWLLASQTGFPEVCPNRVPTNSWPVALRDTVVPERCFLSPQETLILDTKAGQRWDFQVC